MLNRALTFSTIAILFLLALQGIWLVRLIENEKNQYRSNSETVLRESINQELQSRLKNLVNKNFRVTISSSIPENIANNDPANVKAFDLSQKQNSITKITIEEALQEAYKFQKPLNLDSLSHFFDLGMQEKGKSTNYIFIYSSPDTIKKIEQRSYKPSMLFYRPSFKITIPLTGSKDLIVTAEIFYPRSVFKGDLLTILIISLIVTIFILFSIVMQTRMLYKQVSLAKVKENITHFLTHELRSPLQSSITNLEVGEISQGDNSKYFLGKAKEQLYFLNGLIENILDINKFEKRQAPLRKMQFDINEAIEPHIIRHNVDAKKTVKLSAEVMEGCELFYGDKLHITNAIGNLVDNAIKYSDDPVIIKIAVKCSDKYFNISVEDNGIGIPKEEQSKVFEKFYRIGKKEYSQKGKGFGLGLTYVMWVVKAHKGKISLESEVGKGSKFILSLKNERGVKEDIIS